MVFEDGDLENYEGLLRQWCHKGTDVELPASTSGRNYFPTPHSPSAGYLLIEAPTEQDSYPNPTDSTGDYHDDHSCVFTSHMPTVDSGLQLSSLATNTPDLCSSPNQNEHLDSRASEHDISTFTDTLHRILLGNGKQNLSPQNTANLS